MLFICLGCDLPFFACHVHIEMNNSLYSKLSSSLFFWTLYLSRKIWKLAPWYCDPTTHDRKVVLPIHKHAIKVLWHCPFLLTVTSATNSYRNFKSGSQCEKIIAPYSMCAGKASCIVIIPVSSLGGGTSVVKYSHGRAELRWLKDHLIEIPHCSFKAE